MRNAAERIGNNQEVWVTSNAEETKSEIGSEQILLVDDNPINLQILYKTLQGSGYRLLIAKNGQSALEIARRVKPSLVLLNEVTARAGRGMREAGITESRISSG